MESEGYMTLEGNARGYRSPSNEGSTRFDEMECKSAKGRERKGKGMEDNHSCFRTINESTHNETNIIIIIRLYYPHSAGVTEPADDTLVTDYSLYLSIALYKVTSYCPSSFALTVTPALSIYFFSGKFCECVRIFEYS